MGAKKSEGYKARQKKQFNGHHEPPLGRKPGTKILQMMT
jgi:hypothetical protein